MDLTKLRMQKPGRRFPDLDAKVRTALRLTVPFDVSIIVFSAIQLAALLSAGFH